MQKKARDIIGEAFKLILCKNKPLFHAQHFELFLSFGRFH